MILKSLYDYALSHSDTMPPPGMEWKEIEFVIVIDRDGNFLRLESRRIDKKFCAKFLVPKGVKRTAAPKSNILWDNAKYVLGKGKNSERCIPLFIEHVKNIAELNPESDEAQALLKFYNTLPEQELKMVFDPLYEDVVASASNISFRLQTKDTLIAENQSLYSHLLQNVPEDAIVGRCLITGEEGPLVRTTTATPLPDNSPMAALVSFQVNSGYDSYGKSQALNSPISIAAEEMYSGVLKSFLAKDSRHKVRLGDRMLLFWCNGQAEVADELEEGFLTMFNIPDKKESNTEEKLQNVEKLFKSIFSGKIKTSLEDRFCILGLAPNTGRIAVVLWMDAPLKEFASMMARHFEDMEIVDYRNLEKRKPYQGVYSMISAATMGGKLSDALPRLIEETVKAVIYGLPYPTALYSQVLQRIRAELQDIGPTIQRASILKAYLNRKYRNNNHITLSTMLDKSNTNPGYLCGRLTAVLEKIQADANSGDSIRTRYMGAASATPAAVFPAMLNVSMHHSEKLSDKNQIFFERLKQEIVDKISDKGFPAHLDLNDQGRFFVGYYHQRADLYTKKEKETI